MISSEKDKKIIVRHIVNTSKKYLEKHTCSYYRQCNETFDIEHLGPKGLCLDLYFAAYPYFLGLLYGAEFSWEKDKDAVNAQCPAPDGNVHFEVRRVPLRKEVISRGVRKKYKIMLKIAHVEKKTGEYINNSCICSHKVGEEFEFNQGDFLEQMCPAAFYNIYPVLKLMLNGGKECWKKNNRVYMQCPDNKTAIMFEVYEEK